MKYMFVITETGVIKYTGIVQVKNRLYKIQNKNPTN